MSAATADPHSFARPQEAVMTHLSLRLTVDFERKILSGAATIRYKSTPGARQLVLDTRDLAVESVLCGTQPAQWTFGTEAPFMGKPLTIAIQAGEGEVTVRYSTSPEAAALQWLEPGQTDGKEHPFMFSQSQAILARTWAPVQDSPGIRFTYDAEVTVPAGLMALMSAENPTAVSHDGNYRFRMNQPVPAYLLALAAGDLRFHAFDSRCGVYAEPSLLEKSAYEFADLPRMIEAAETLYGPYAWERYDLLVLPKSFPFGGMENPRLTFATPTIIAGDRSLTSLVAHELAHSWSGNLVTNETWSDFWLNEGFTVYFENRIMEALYGKEFADMQKKLGQTGLLETVEELGPSSPDTRLKLQLQGRDPDDGMNDIAYEKGNNLLLVIEAYVGRERWDAFLRGYFSRHAFSTTNTEAFLTELKEQLFQDDPSGYLRLKIDEWVYQPGIPSNLPVIESVRFTAVEEQAKLFSGGTPAVRLNTQGWTPFEWVHFLQELPEGLSMVRLSELDSVYRLTGSRNNEVLFQWMMTCLTNGYDGIYPALEEFLVEVGRRKFVKPLYQELVKTPSGREEAEKVFERAKGRYHAITRETVSSILENSRSH
jgi:aminopeptidase N